MPRAADACLRIFLRAAGNDSKPPLFVRLVDGTGAAIAAPSSQSRDTPAAQGRCHEMDIDGHDVPPCLRTFAACLRPPFSQTRYRKTPRTEPFHARAGACGDTRTRPAYVGEQTHGIEPRRCASPPDCRNPVAM